MSVDYRCKEYHHCDQERIMIRALSEGTCGMRMAGKDLLPKEKSEEEADYQARLKRSFLFNAYGNAKETLVGKIYANPVQLEGNSPIIEQISEDADLMGRDITSFMRAVQDDAFDHGVSFILVDMPQAPKEYTMLDQEELNLRPYFVHVKRDQLIGWDFERIGGVDVLKEIRIEEQFYERKYPDAAKSNEYNYEEIEVTQVRSIKRDLVTGKTNFQIWRESDKNEGWEIVDEGEWTLGHISLVPVATKMISRLVGEPPLRDLAFLNVQHWQSASDQKNILHLARVPILFGKQIGSNRPESIGSGVAVWAEDESADMKYVEIQGLSIEAGREDIKDIEDRMSILAYEPQVARTGNVTATSKAIDQAKANTQVEAWSLSAEDGIRTALAYAHMWMQSGEDFDVSLDRDFGIGAEQSEDAKILLDLWKNGGITSELLLKELKRRNIINADEDIEVQVAQVDETLEGMGGGLSTPQTS